MDSANFVRVTESESLYQNIESMSTMEILSNINKEDYKIAAAIEKSLPQIEKLINALSPQLKLGGRLFYIGAGTSGRLGMVDASECPPTYGVPEDKVLGIIAGGKEAMFHAVENAEDDTQQAWLDLSAHAINSKDFVIGIAASGTTPYVIAGLEACQKNGIPTGSISCNAGSPLSASANYPIEVVVGPEFITGSTRMKSGTAQKLVLNMISTTAMIQLGRIKGNKMINMQLTNQKLIDRGTQMIMDALGITEVEAVALLKKQGSVKNAIENSTN